MRTCICRSTHRVIRRWQRAYHDAFGCQLSMCGFCAIDCSMDSPIAAAHEYAGYAESHPDIRGKSSSIPRRNRDQE